MFPTVYLVGGAVRDHLLNFQSNDRDYVVVGATPEWMIQQGYKQVGSSFPVYLHPETEEEYALARQERKSGHGYHGFEVTYDTSVTLEDDLMRRDLTINSMAMTIDGKIIDPFNGQDDLKNGILRHTSDAFADDPLRVLRLARFAARYGFQVHPSTIELSRKLVESGELEHLPKERIWKEIYKGLKEPNPVNMIKVLHEVGALDDHPVREYFPKDIVQVLNWLDNVFYYLPDLSVEDKFLLIMGNLAEEYKNDYNDKMRSLCVPSHFSKMASKLTFFANHMVTMIALNADRIFDIIEGSKYVQEHNNDDWKCIIKVLRIEEIFGVFQSRFEINLIMLNKAVNEVKKIDMQQLLEAGPKSKMKERVIAAKREAINFSLKG